jgi:hypothetical protein
MPRRVLPKQRGEIALVHRAILSTVLRARSRQQRARLRPADWEVCRRRVGYVYFLARMDFVALDLSGYRPQHTGTRHELQRVIDRYPIDRVTLFAETTSDRLFLTAQVEAVWDQMTDGSPNAGTGTSTAYVIALFDR